MSRATPAEAVKQILENIDQESPWEWLAGITVTVTSDVPDADIVEAARLYMQLFRRAFGAHFERAAPRYVQTVSTTRGR